MYAEAASHRVPAEIIAQVLRRPIKATFCLVVGMSHQSFSTVERSGEGFAEGILLQRKVSCSEILSSTAQSLGDRFFSPS